ncbi:MAG: dihydrolipoamide acetyltransferase family protein [Phycisphaerales bacterium]|nr:dihydrolipoamide acetyltransferase family protein [Phycisphaerales bacterium]
MSIEVTMPRLSDTMEAGTIIQWNVGVGDEVASGDVLADIETDKATMEMQAFDDGVIAGLLVEAGKQVPVGTTIAVLAEDGETPEDAIADAASEPPAAEPEAAPAASKPAAAPAAPSAPVAPVPAPAAPSPQPMVAPISAAPSAPAQTPAGGRIKVSPVARRIAEENHLSLSELTGSGPGGRIIKRDVLARIAAGVPSVQSGSAPVAAAPAPGTGTLVAGEEDLSGMRQTIARRLVESKTTIPHYQVSMSFDMASMTDVRSQVNERLAAQGAKASVNDFLIKACALAIRDHKYFNSSFAGERLVMHGAINIGVAIALPEERGGGLVVATIRHADQLSVREIADKVKELSLKARTRGLSAEDMSESTFTISNLGMFGVDHFTAIINPPNSAILACGAAIEQPVVENGEVVPGLRMTGTLSLDHRVIDGAMAARFLQSLKMLVEKPAMLLV